ncbi:CRISPR-associated protein Csm3 [Nodosilinea sp. LEGE 07088]|uniref:RAMP superfamily CRISPR-associated protein n=1 Tax=Nodosilinea sp. LEGE 07088 TaxID=2777968 RepID=UPI0018831021|nr:RAMP superfamily CRISPR-associated protein [Nodosilinea sp. LEGE 07088]MBE9138825.1 CRISPR-associated protein Csm3 [Nodosilinea sp. LEGE 07088]
MVQLSRLTQTTEAIPLTALIDSALCVGAGGSSGSLADKPIIRNAQGQLLIPGSQLKGRLRHECEKLARALSWPICESPTPTTMCPQRLGLDESRFVQTGAYDIGKRDINENIQRHCLICQIFGNPSLASRIEVDDLVCQVEPENLPEVLRPGVTLNRRRRTAEDQKLYYLETSPANVQLPFSGHLYLEPACLSQTKPLILAALHHIHALGGSKSAGLGWLRWQPFDQTLEDKDWSSLLEGNAS